MITNTTFILTRTIMQLKLALYFQEVFRESKDSMSHRNLKVNVSEPSFHQPAPAVRADVGDNE